jgi:hydroxypyruvate reductase
LPRFTRGDPACPTPIEILTVSKLPPLLAQPLNAAYTVHDRLHETDPVAFDVVASRIRGIAASGESKVTAELIARCRRWRLSR